MSIFYVYLYLNKESVNIDQIIERLPPDTDFKYILRVNLYNALKPFMDRIMCGDFILKMTQKTHYYRIEIVSLGGESYNAPDDFIDKYIEKYNKLYVDGCDLYLEYEIDDS